MTDYKKQGKRNLAKGREFELIVRKDLEKKNLIVTKWMNNIDLSQNRLIQAKSGRFRRLSTGFPDFISFGVNKGNINNFTFIEVRSNGYLDKEEKSKAEWYINKFGLPFIIAKKSKKRGEVEYKEFKLEET